MNNYRYILEKYSGRNSRFACPECGATHQFSKYIDIVTGEVLADDVGRCNRIDKCSYHYSPKQYFNDNGIKPEKVDDYIPALKAQEKAPSYIEVKTFDESRRNYHNNNFVIYLDTLFDTDTVDYLVNIYKIGTSKRYNGGTTIFWQIDALNNIRTGKLIKYDANGHRIKACNNWVHSVLRLDNFNLKQCFFGEHILKHTPNCKVGIVESEKTAMIMAASIPKLTWLATGGAEGISENKVKVLSGRKVILFPDASTDSRIYQKWNQKAKEFGFDISNYLEKHSNEKQKLQGVDVADFIMKQHK